MFKKRWISTAMYLALLLLSISLIVHYGGGFPTDDTFITTSKLMQVAEDGDISNFVYDPSKKLITGEMSFLTEDKKEEVIPFTSFVSGEESFNEFVKVAQRNNKEVTWDVISSEPGFLIVFLSNILPTLIFGIIIFFFAKSFMKGNGGIMNFGKSKARLSHDTDTKITFKDVAGCDEAVDELKEIKEFLEHPEKFKKLGAKIPHGVLLVGPPGTGKTLLAKAVAGEANVPFYTVSGSDFVEMFVGVGSSRIRDTFAQAKSSSPSIIFIDEIDAVGGRRGGGGSGGSHEEREQTLNALLVEMDGFEEKETVIVMAATNRPDILDPALLRPGRFDRQIVVDQPDMEGREEILKIHSKGKPFADNVNLKDLAKTSGGMSGADLANLINESALLAARRGGETIENSDLKEALERVVAGLKKKSRVLNEKERLIVAYHEAGHALVGHLMEDSDPINKVTILPRGRALGYTLSLPEEDTFLEGKKELRADLSMLLGGRAAEEIVFGDITTGASNDIERASKIATKMVMQFGMSSKLGPRSFANGTNFLGSSNETGYISDKVASVIDEEVDELITTSYSDAKELLITHRERLEKMVEVLLEKETIEGEILDNLLAGTYQEYASDNEEKEII